MRNGDAIICLKICTANGFIRWLVKNNYENILDISKSCVNRVFSRDFAKNAYSLSFSKILQKYSLYHRKLYIK